MRFFAVSLSSLLPHLVCSLAQSAAAVLADLTCTTVTPLANQLLYANSGNATQEALTPIVNQLSTAVTGAVGNMNLLIGQPTEVILASADGTTLLTASEIATLLAVVVNLIFTAINAVLLVTDVAIYGLILRIASCTRAKVVFSLLSVVLFLVVGLLAPLLVLVAPVESIISGLDLTTLLGELLGGTL